MDFKYKMKVYLNYREIFVNGIKRKIVLFLCNKKIDKQNINDDHLKLFSNVLKQNSMLKNLYDQLY